MNSDPLTIEIFMWIVMRKHRPDDD